MSKAMTHFWAWYKSTGVIDSEFTRIYGGFRTKKPDKVRFKDDGEWRACDIVPRRAKGKTKVTDRCHVMTTPPTAAVKESGATPPTPIGVLVKLGSIAVHAEELLGPGSHPYAVSAIRDLLAYPDVVKWRLKMDKLGLLPKQR